MKKGNNILVIVQRSKQTENRAQNYCRIKKILKKNVTSRERDV